MARAQGNSFAGAWSKNQRGESFFAPFFFARSYIVRTARTADAPDDRIALGFDIRKTKGIIVLSFHRAKSTVQTN